MPLSTEGNAVFETRKDAQSVGACVHVRCAFPLPRLVTLQRLAMESSPALPFQPDEAPKPVSMRGRKKHKCSVCGNSAKSRCPFHACKGCCVKAKNPCHIHVLKSTPAGESVPGLLEKLTPLPAASTAVVWQPHPYDSLRLRTFKPLGIITRKEASLINHLRFEKLKEYREGITETEDIAFDRYLQNMRQLEEIFGGEMQDYQKLPSEGQWIMEGARDGENGRSEGLDAYSLSTELRTRLWSSSKRKEAQRQRIKVLIDRGLERLIKGEQGDGMLDNEDLYSIYSDVRRDMKKMKVQTAEGKERLRKMDLFASVTEKVKQVESQEDYDSCLKAFEENFASRNTSSISSDISHGPHSEELSKPVGENGSIELLLNSEKGVLKLGTWNNGRVDSCGVLKSWWKVDFFPAKLDSSIDIPTTALQAL